MGVLFSRPYCLPVGGFLGKDVPKEKQSLYTIVEGLQLDIMSVYTKSLLPSTRL